MAPGHTSQCTWPLRSPCGQSWAVWEERIPLFPTSQPAHRLLSCHHRATSEIPVTLQVNFPMGSVPPTHSVFGEGFDGVVDELRTHPAWLINSGCVSFEPVRGTHSYEPFQSGLQIERSRNTERSRKSVEASDPGRARVMMPMIPKVGSTALHLKVFRIFWH